MKIFILFIAIAVITNGCGYESVKSENTPEDMTEALSGIDFPVQDDASFDQIIGYLESNKVSFEINIHDKSMPCSRSRVQTQSAY